VTQERRLADLSTRLPGLRAWPRRLLVTAVDAVSGERVVLDEASDVPILTAVAASCAVPGVWPPVTVGDRRLIDGGVRSPANADLAAGCDRVVVLAPTPTGFRPGSAAAAQVAAFGDRAVVLAPDRTAKRAFGRDRLDPAHRAAAAQAGFAQAAHEAARVATVWGDASDSGETGDAGDGRAGV
jgi:NTE family protein